MDIKKVVGGVLYQDADVTSDEDFTDYKVATERAPSDEELKTLLKIYQKRLEPLLKYMLPIGKEQKIF